MEDQWGRYYSNIEMMPLMQQCICYDGGEHILNEVSNLSEIQPRVTLPLLVPTPRPAAGGWTEYLGLLQRE